MTIETSPTQNTTRPAATESKCVKPKAVDGSAPGAASPGGFMAILAALDVSEPTAGVSDSTADADLATANLQKLLQSIEDDTGDAVLSTTADTTRPPDFSEEASVLLAQAAQWSAVPTAGAEQSIPGAMKGAFANGTVAAKFGFGPDKAQGIAISSTALGDATAEGVGKTGKSQKDAFARLVSAQGALADAAAVNSPMAEARQAQALQRVVDAPQHPIASALVAATIAAPARGEEIGRERSVFRSNAPDVALPVQTYTAAASPASFVNAPPAPMASMDAYVAEQVAYWISNDIQNAEMKLDGIGEMPVEVSIRMQGNEAHIAFRSDELQARAALENASEHLKDLLQREGLVLSGVSVGTAGAGAGDGNAQERKSRQGARQAGVVSVQPTRADSVATSTRSAGGAVDLFV